MIQPIQPISDALLRDLVSDAHQAGITNLAVGAIIDSGGRVLLLENSRRTVDDPHQWRIPGYSVYPGETLLDALDRGLTTSESGLEVDEITGYLGSFDHDADGTELIRFFVFTAIMQGANNLCHVSHTAHQWVDHLDQLAVMEDVRLLLDRYFASPLPS